MNQRILVCARDFNCERERVILLFLVAVVVLFSVTFFFYLLLLFILEMYPWHGITMWITSHYARCSLCVYTWCVVYGIVFVAVVLIVVVRWKTVNQG